MTPYVPVKERPPKIPNRMDAAGRALLAEKLATMSFAEIREKFFPHLTPGQLEYAAKKLRVQRPKRVAFELAPKDAKFVRENAHRKFGWLVQHLPQYTPAQIEWYRRRNGLAKKRNSPSYAKR